MKIRKLFMLISALTLAACATSNNSKDTSIGDTSNSNIETPNSVMPPSLDHSSIPVVDIEDNNTEQSVSLPSISVTPDDNYSPNNDTEIFLKDNDSKINNNNGGVAIDGNNIYIVKEGIYKLEGNLSNGKIIINPEDETSVVEIDLSGVTISCDYGAPIGIFNGDKCEISAKNGTTNEIYDRRMNLEQTQDGSNAAIYSLVDLKIKGKGSLKVDATYNNGIGSKKDLEIKNLNLEIIAPNNTLKGNDSLTIESGTITAISTLGDTLKTSNSNISSKGNQRGKVTILDGTINLYSACDAIDAAHDVTIGGELNPTINIFTESYSPYSQEVTVTSNSTLYLGIQSFDRWNSSTIDTANTYFAGYFTLDDNTNEFIKFNKINSSNGGNGGHGSNGSNTTYYSLSKPSKAQKVTFYGFDNSQTEMNTTTFKYQSENMTIPTLQDTYKVSSFNGTTLNGNWTNYSTQMQPGGGGFPGGGMQEGNPNAAEYSCKGIKSDNKIEIKSGNISITSHDDSIHASNINLLETNVYGVGDVLISGGNILINSDDDGIHADNALTISGGNTKVKKSYEGLEGTTININGGVNQVFANDDGINAAGNGNQSKVINFTAGVSYFNANGDVIDSNGNINMTGGVVFALGPSKGGNGVLDFDGSFRMSGGFLFAFGSADMAQKPTANGVTITSNSNMSVSQNNYINVMSGNETIASMRVTMTNLRYYVLGYESNYGSNLIVSQSSTTNVTLIDDLYYFYQ